MKKTIASLLILMNLFVYSEAEAFLGDLFEAGKEVLDSAVGGAVKSVVGDLLGGVDSGRSGGSGDDAGRRLLRSALGGATEAISSYPERNGSMGANMGMSSSGGVMRETKPIKANMLLPSLGGTLPTGPTVGPITKSPAGGGVGATHGGGSGEPFGGGERRGRERPTWGITGGTTGSGPVGSYGGRGGGDRGGSGGGGGILGMLKGVGKGLLGGAIGSILGGVGGSLGSVANKVFGSIGSALGGITGQLGSALGGITGGIGSAISGITGGIGSAVSGITGQLGSAVSGIAGSMGSAISGITGQLGSAVSGIAGKMGSALGGITGKLGSVLGGTGGAFGEILGGGGGGLGGLFGGGGGGGGDAGGLAQMGSDCQGPTASGYCVQLQESILKYKSVRGANGYQLISVFIHIIYKYLASMIGIICVLIIAISGGQMMFGVVSEEAMGSAKARIGQALLSLIFLFMTALILKTISPGFYA